MKPKQMWNAGREDRFECGLLVQNRKRLFKFDIFGA